MPSFLEGTILRGWRAHVALLGHSPSTPMVITLCRTAQHPTAPGSLSSAVQHILQLDQTAFHLPYCPPSNWIRQPLICCTAHPPTTPGILSSAVLPTLQPHQAASLSHTAHPQPQRAAFTVPSSLHRMTQTIYWVITQLLILLVIVFLVCSLLSSCLSNSWN